MGIKIYCDGACSGNQFKENVGGWGAVMIYENALDNQGYVKNIQGATKNTTNNIMEIVACIEPLKLIKDKNIPIEIYSDSQYVVSTINDKWKKKKNIELWIELQKLIDGFTNIKFIKVKGHSDNLYNCRADELANEAINKIKGE